MLGASWIPEFKTDIFILLYLGLLAGSIKNDSNKRNVHIVWYD